MNRGFYRLFGKRFADLLLVVLLAPMWLPTLAAVALAVRIALGRPLVFRQLRPGLKGRPFTLLKFRTMTDARGPDGELLEDERRQTCFGRFLRSTSLDELPELWNVLRGEMGIVGPRPLLMQYLARYSAEQMRRHEVRPGLTGWAQVHGRNGVPWEQRFKLDVWYVDHCSLLLDAWILAKTAVQVVRRVGVSAEGHATMPEFQSSASTDRSDQVRALATTRNRPVWVLGAGGHAKVVVRTLQEAGLEIAGILDDYQAMWGQRLFGVPIDGPLAKLKSCEGEPAVVAIGDGQNRKQIVERFDQEWISVVHPRAIVDRTASLGQGVVVFAGAIIQADSRIGDHVIINTAATVDHDCVVADFAHIAPGAHVAGNVRIGRGAMMGIGSCAIPSVQVGDWTKVGAGATVIRDLPAGVLAVGCPARVIEASGLEETGSLRRVS